MKRVILITGTSSGFGKHISIMLRNSGHIVFGTVRNRDCVEDPVYNPVMDVTDHHSVRQTVENIISREGRLDVLINNAGIVVGGSLETTPDDNVKLLIETNFTSLVFLTREVLPVMRRQGGGRIINFSSIGGLMGLPFQGYYSASKFAIEGFSEALRMEVRRFNIDVIVINPGDFRTGNTATRRKFLPPAGESDPYTEQFLRTLEVIEKDETGGLDPDLLARKMVRIVECKHPRQRYVIASIDQKLAVILKNFLPGRWFSKILQGHYKISFRTF